MSPGRGIPTRNIGLAPLELDFGVLDREPADWRYENRVIVEYSMAYASLIDRIPLGTGVVQSKTGHGASSLLALSCAGGDWVKWCKWRQDRLCGGCSSA